MAAPRFERDPRKDAGNRRTHGLSFDEAQTVFADEHALLLDDPDHSATEERFILLGLSAAFRVLVVVHGCRDRDDMIRIISARRRPSASVNDTRRGGGHETRIRFLKGETKPLREPS
jgi:uncharacterized DUF497 family protein